MREELTDTAPAAGDSGELPLMIDRFVIEDELGAGGMGRVYVAYDPKLERRVAVKVLRGQLGIDVALARARMEREARAMARLRHPNVVTVHEVGADTRGVYIVMEYVAGRTLRAWQMHDPAPSWSQIVAMYVLAGRGIAAAHASGLVHRDFKPDNVFVGDDGRVLVGDFGLANVGADEPATEDADGDPISDRLTRTGAVLGTPAYMSPEQHAGAVVDARSDQFAFCAALYEVLYGVRPFAGKTGPELAARARRDELAPPVRDPGVPPRIRAAIQRGLRGDPDQRFPAMAPLLDELAPRRGSRARWGALLAAGLVAAIAAWIAVRPSHAPAAAAPSPVGVIAVEPFGSTLPFGDRAEWRQGIGDIVALSLADIDGLKAVGPRNLLAGERPDLHAAEAKLAPSFIVRGSIDRHAEILRAHVEIVDPRGGSRAVDIERPTEELAKLLEDITNRVAETIAPGHHLDPAHAATRAHALYAIGDEHLRNDRFQVALPFLEQTVIADPKFFEGWYALALTRSWVLAPESTVFAAVEAARTTVPGRVERALVDGLASYLHHDLSGARAVLEPLVAEPTLSKTEQRDALYLLGEAHWHDGRHRAGVGFFRRAIDLDMTFKPPVQHLGEYAMANRDVAMLEQYSYMIASSASEYRDFGELARGHYEELAKSGAPPTRLYATLLLGRTPPVELESELGSDVIVAHIYHAAVALEHGTPAVARTSFDAIWSEVAARRTAGGELPDSAFYLLRILGDVVLCAEHTDEVRRLVTFLAAESRHHPVRSYQRLSILAAPIIGDRALIVRRDLTDRDRQLADAIEAEMTGDRAKAVELLAAIVHDPSPMWDYPERAALLRNLRALHRDREARALCADTLRPAVFELAYLPLRPRCTSP